jgi:aminopeptidase N
MFGKIAAFEFRYQLRQPVFYVVTLVFFLLSFGSVASENVSFGLGPNVHKNAPTAIAIASLFFGMFYMLVTTAFVANVVIRDDATGYGPIVRSTRVRKFDYLFGRFIGAFGAVLVSFLAVPLGMMAGTLAPWVDPETLGPFRFGDYAYNYAAFAVPSLLLTSALFFALATVTRSMMATYLGVVGLFVAYLVGSSFLGRPEIEEVGALLDPFGITAFSKAIEYWTTAENNTRNVRLTGEVLTNRALVVGLCLALLALAYALFRFETRGKAARKKEKLARQLEAPVATVRPTGPLPAPRFGGAAAWSTLVKRTRFEMAQIFKSPALPVLLLLGVFQVGTVLWFSTENELTAVYPLTRLMIDGARNGMSLILIIVATYYAGELVWRERERRVHEITDSSAVPDWAFVLPKALGISLVLISLMVAAILTGIVLQTIRGYTNYELGKYLAWYLLPEAVGAFCFAALAVFVQVLSPHKFVGWGIMVIYMISRIVLGNLGFDHPLYSFGASAAVPLSDMNGQGDYRGFAWWFDAYWSALAVIMLVLSYALWRRGTESRYLPRLRRLPRRLAGAPGIIGGVALVAFVALGSFIFVNTTVWNEYRSRQGWEKLQADYEKALLRYENTPQPSVTTVKLALDLDPHTPRLVTRGQYVLENRTGAPLREVHLRSQERDLKFRTLAVEGARRTRAYDEFRYWIYSFDRPMAPGERRTVDFVTELAQRGFRAGGNTTRLVDNGSFINNGEFAPSVGMDRSGLLQERAKRRKHGLPPELRMAKLENPAARRFNYVRADWVNADITVTTVADQTPIAPGYKVSDVTRDGRRTARFVTEAPILHFFSVQSARYAVKTERYKGVELSIYHHPAHTWNVDRMIRALKTGLDYYQANYGPYQFRQARIIEFPAYANFAQAFANTMPYSESIGFAARYRDEEKIDYVTMVTAHELAHQWWAHQIVGADAQGATSLSETLAEYSALMVMEKTNGPARLRKFLKFELDGYLGGRGQDPLGESPLVRVEAGQQYIHYQKGGLVLYLLRDWMGEAPVNRALQRVLNDYRFKGAPYPTSAELVRALRAEAGPQHQGLITDLFERITLYDAKAQAAKAVRRPDGRWDVTLTVAAKKLYANAEGDETEAPLNEQFDVGVFTAEPGKKDFDEKDVLVFQRRPVRSGAQTFTFTVDRKPTHAGVDPYNKWIDRDSDDNTVAVTEG